MNLEEKAAQLANELVNVQDVLVALGDTNRQHLLLQMIRHADAHGMRVGEMAEKSNLSRPTISHHLAILKSAGIVSVRQEGTRNYYYFDAEESLLALQKAISHALWINNQLPELRDENNND